MGSSRGGAADEHAEVGKTRPALHECGARLAGQMERTINAVYVVLAFVRLRCRLAAECSTVETEYILCSLRYSLRQHTNCV